MLGKPSAYAKDLKLNQINPDHTIKVKKYLKKKIQSILASEYTLDKTHVKFVGWNDCPDDTSDKLVIFVLSSSAGTEGISSIGSKIPFQEDSGKVLTIQDIISQLHFYSQKNLYKNNPHKYIAVMDFKQLRSQIRSHFNSDLNQFHFDNYYRYLILHEFGHSLGLMHEEFHPNFKNRMNCNADSIGFQFYGQHNDFALTKYDWTSVMGYCFSQANEKIWSIVMEKYLSEKKLKDKIEDIYQFYLKKPQLFLNMSYYINWDYLRPLAKKLKIKNRPLSLSEDDRNILKRFY